MNDPRRAAVRMVLGALWLAACSVAQAGQLLLTLKPVPGASVEEIAAIDVRLELDAAAATAAARGFVIEHVTSNVVTTAPLLVLQARDAQGELPLAMTDSGADPTLLRRWMPQRAIVGAMELSYRAPILNRLAPRGAAPPLELRSEAGAFSGAGATFLVLPDSETPQRLVLRWDLSALTADARAASSLGVGDVAEPGADAPQRLARSFFMAGRIGLFPQQPAPRGFFAVWQGGPPFDAAQLLAWTAALHGRYLAFFQQPGAPSYGVFLRRNLVNPGGGIGLAGSFVATYDTGTNATDLKLTLAHEMFHTFAPAIVAPGGLASSWFGEGLAVFYERELPLRFGMLEPQAFLDDLNFTAGRYFTSLYGDVPNDTIPRRFWADTRVRTIPYDRGAMYFSTVDAALRRHSGGRRSLDDLLLALVRAQRSGRKLATADWEAQLQRNLGSNAVAQFRAMQAGAWVTPPSDAFGDCFERYAKSLRRYELGFDSEVLTQSPRIVRGLVAGSTAEQAGLRDGDEILKPVSQDILQGTQTREIELQLRRDGRDFTLRYLPRGESVDAWQWRYSGRRCERTASRDPGGKARQR